jgi:hypothetical protein
MRLILEVTSGPLQGKQIEAKVGMTVRIGRTTKADIATDDNFMSGEHFAVECGINNCRLRDLNSRNGTELNGKVVAEADLNDGDKVHAGRSDFVVRITGLPPNVESSPAVGKSPRKAAEVIPGEPVAKAPKQPKKPTAAPYPPAAPEPATTPDPTSARAANVMPKAPLNAPSPQRKGERESTGRIDDKPQPRLDAAPPIAAPPAQSEFIPPSVLESYEAATPEGRLIHILGRQPGSLMALVDAAHDPKLLDLLRGTTEEYQSLYRSDQKASIVPYLVRLPAQSELLKQMVRQGWGHEWGVYLTAPLNLMQMREFFRSSLMVTMPDGMELFSRFYDPGFFRTFLETCSAAEAEKFYGPITSYFMEDERPEILLQFSRSKRGAEKKGHLLSVLAS